MKNAQKENTVSRETLALLKVYQDSLNEWQEKMNLVSKNSLPQAWERHFLDSMQLFDLLPENAKLLYDLGSGAGFPGMVLAIMAKYKTPYLKVKLVESTTKKTLYLKEVAKLTGANVEIINQRIEKLNKEEADVITSRALASLTELLQYSKPFSAKHTKCLFLKGKTYLEELKEAQQNWDFDCEILPNQQNPEGVILVITNLYKKGEKHA